MERFQARPGRVAPRPKRESRDSSVARQSASELSRKEQGPTLERQKPSLRERERGELPLACEHGYDNVPEGKGPLRKASETVQTIDLADEHYLEGFPLPVNRTNQERRHQQSDHRARQIPRPATGKGNENQDCGDDHFSVESLF